MVNCWFLITFVEVSSCSFNLEQFFCILILLNFLCFCTFKCNFCLLTVLKGVSGESFPVMTECAPWFWWTWHAFEACLSSGCAGCYYLGRRQGWRWLRTQWPWGPSWVHDWSQVAGSEAPRVGLSWHYSLSVHDFPSPSPWILAAEGRGVETGGAHAGSCLVLAPDRILIYLQCAICLGTQTIFSSTLLRWNLGCKSPLVSQPITAPSIHHPLPALEPHQRAGRAFVDLQNNSGYELWGSSHHQPPWAASEVLLE